MIHLNELLKSASIKNVNISRVEYDTSTHYESHPCYITLQSKGLLAIPGVLKTNTNTYRLIWGHFLINEFVSQRMKSVPCFLLPPTIDIDNSMISLWQAEHYLSLISVISPRDTQAMIPAANTLLKALKYNKKEFIHAFTTICGVTDRHARDYYNIVSSTDEVKKNVNKLRLHDLASKVLDNSN